jgi:hypothetical protein
MNALNSNIVESIIDVTAELVVIEDNDLMCIGGGADIATAN